MTSLDIALLARPGEAPKRIPLLTSTTTIGRVQSSLVHIDDAYISRRHAVIIKHHGHFHVRNLSRTSGTWLNGEKLELGPDGEHPLRYDDVRTIHAPAPFASDRAH